MSEHDEPMDMDDGDMDEEGIVTPFEDEDPSAYKGGENDLECDVEAYVLFHEGRTDAPCLSFDILKDDLGEKRTCDEPIACSFVAGTQANKTHLNSIILLNVKNLRKVRGEDNDDDNEEFEDSDSEDEDGNAVPLKAVTSLSVKHNGCVNRLRCASIDNKNFAASWSELGTVNIWELNPMQQWMSTRSGDINAPDGQFKPIFSYNQHKTEGYAIDWSPTTPGMWASGDCHGNIKIGKADEARWSVLDGVYTSHTKSVEDIQWSPNEPNVFASCSVDKSIKIWDMRANPKKACMLTCSNAHSSDINVIHWNRNQPFIASGGDDANVFIWDLKKFQTNESVAKLTYHTKPITSVEWHPTEESVLATAAEDDQIFQWDLAVEKDTEAGGDPDVEDLPAQLLFAHKGQKEVKELHWHSQIPGLVISTAHSGFNIFKTISC